MIRTGFNTAQRGDGEAVRRAIQPIVRHVAIEHVLETPPVRLVAVPGFERAVLPYTTDIPFLVQRGRPLLLGPGSIHVAHTADEFVSVRELNQAVGRHSAIAEHLLFG